MPALALRITSPSDLEAAGRLLASLGIGLSLVDRELRVQWANAFVREQTQELSCGADHCFAAMWNATQPCSDCLPRQVFRSGKASEGIRERGRPGAVPEAWRVRAIPVHDASGQLTWVAECLVRLGQLEPALLGGAAAEAAGPAFLVVDREERIVSWGQAAAAIFGHSMGQALGRRIDLIVPPDRLEEERSVAARVAREERVARFETVRRARDGRDVPVALTASALRDESGALVGRSCVLEDLSTLQRLRSRVASQEQLLAHITHEAADAIVGVDPQGLITSWNRGAERLLGVDGASVLGRPGGEVMGEQPLRTLLRLVASQGAVRGHRMEWRDARGESLPMDVSAAPLAAPGEGGPGVALVARDLSAQLRLDRQLIRSEKMAVVGSLAAGMAHEIGTPLNVISATAEYLMKGGGGEEDRRLREIVAETDRISRLVRELLTFARGSPPGRAAIRPADAVERALRLARITFDRKQIQVTRDLPEDGLLVRADPDGLHQVLLNLLMNAAQAVGEGGRIAIQVRPGQEGEGQPTVVIEVDDDGPGVAPDQRERIFDPFFTTRADGTGLGLAVCARIVADHGGDIRVGQGPLGGASFVVQLPAVLAEVTA